MDKDKQFQQDIRKKLEQQTLSAQTRDALRAARMSAMDHGTSRPFRGWLPATAMAAIALVVVGAFLYQGVTDVELPQLETDELAIITSEDELELFEELEFYVWFDQDISPDTQG